ncbi:MAG: type IV pilus twitching motility protein PilT [Patescibacteria group bacterium]|nr:type IV pilus twitching motility protein PilT [Patescibacteria group bacterium]
MEIKNLLEKTINSGASDLHLTIGASPTLRINGVLSPIPGMNLLGPDDLENLVFGLLNKEQKELFLVNKELDFSFSLGQKARFRVNAYFQKGYPTVALRNIPFKIPNLDDINLPKVLYEFCKLPQGFVLITGAAGQGKSTTIASMLNYINENRNAHIITIEDPIEYVFPHKKSLVEQREMHVDTHSWEVALRSVLREDPDVVLIGEMRDYETISSALTIAETGHLVFATLHTNSAAQSIDRIIDVFPEYQQQQVRVQLANALEAVVCQRLVNTLDGKRIPAVEILLSTNAVRNVIREGKGHQIDNIIATSLDLGMVSLEHSLAKLVNTGKISLEEAKSKTLKPDVLVRLIKG